MSYLDYLRTLTTKKSIDYNELHRWVNSRTIFDQSFIYTLQKEPLYMERAILNHVVDTFQLAIYFEYISGISGESNAFAYKRTDGTASGLFLDEILDLSILDIFLIIWARAYKPEYHDLCREQLLFLIQDILVNRKVSRNDVVNIIREAHMPDLAVVQAFDMYWCAWTFVIGHELFHIINREKLSTRDEEFKADQFGFQVLIRLIEERKAGIIPQELDCYYEEFYLVPCMLMYIFRAVDLLRKDSFKYGVDDYHPSPEERFQAIVDLFDSDIPDDMDTDIGNSFLNTFLDIFDQLCDV